MWHRRTVYALALGGGLVFYWAYREWLSWLVLMGLILLPWFSLVVSLVPMLTAKPYLSCPETVQHGEKAQVSVVCRGKLPAPPVTAKLRLERRLYGKTELLASPGRLPTEHCARIRISVKRGYLYDYLGLFRHRLRHIPEVWVTVRPEYTPMDTPPDISRYLAHSWRPKPGGGFGESHELRLYRQGDPLRMVHWKLSAKTGKLVLREPMEPLRGRILVTMELSGTADTLDRKLGRLLWVCRYLLSRDMPHELHCLTGNGKVCHKIQDEKSLFAALDSLLASAPAAPDARGTYPLSSRHYHIGGGADEA